MTIESLSNLQDPLWGILLRLAIDVAVLYVIIYLIYFRFSKKRDFIFPLFLMGIMLFMICILLKKSEMQMGMALGLFAIFSIMRFRTENLVTKNMAYLFAVIAVSVINAMFDFPHPVRGTILVNIIIILTILILEISLNKFNKEAEDKAEKKAEKKTEKRAGKNHEKKKFSKHQILYDKLALLNPDKMDDLLSDISKRTGIKIDKVKIRKIDLINANAVLDVYFREKSGKAEM